MGMYDDVTFEANLPPGHPVGERAFQTKSLFNCLDNFTITREGRLMHHSVRYEESGQEGRFGLPMLRAVPVGDVDMKYHGDLRLYTTVAGQHWDYAVRFTHGTLEWIRPWEELSELERALIR